MTNTVDTTRISTCIRYLVSQTSIWQARSFALSRRTPQLLDKYRGCLTNRLVKFVICSTIVHTCIQHRDISYLRDINCLLRKVLHTKTDVPHRGVGDKSTVLYVLKMYGTKMTWEEFDEAIPIRFRALEFDGVDRTSVYTYGIATNPSVYPRRRAEWRTQ